MERGREGGMEGWMEGGRDGRSEGGKGEGGVIVNFLFFRDCGLRLRDLKFTGTI